MDDFKYKSGVEKNEKEKDIIFSKAIKAGKRIYYLDVKKNKKEDMFLTVTESKKVVTGEGENAQFSFEKHKIFLYKEDFEKFMAGMQEAIDFIDSQEGNIEAGDSSVANDLHEIAANSAENDGEISIDIDF